MPIIQNAWCVFRSPYALTLLLLLATPAWGAERQVLKGHVPAAVARLTPTGYLSGSTRLSLAIALPLRNQEALTNLLRQIYDPASPSTTIT